MIILRSKLFSNEKDGPSAKDVAAGTALGTAVIYGVGKGKNKETLLDKTIDPLIRKQGKKLMGSKITAEDEKEIREKLLKDAKKKGIKVVNDSKAGNAAYTGAKSGRKMRNVLAGMKKLSKKIQGGEDLNRAMDQVKNDLGNKMGSKEFFKHLGKDAIVIGDPNSALGQADVISHELGHANYMRSGRGKNALIKGSHKLMTVSKLATSKVGQGASVAHGFKAGVQAERKKQNGEKLSKWDRVKGVALPAAAVAPLLIAEGGASLNGLKAMKKAGASKELLKQSRHRLQNAWNTYALDSTKPIIAGAAGEVAGHVYGKATKDKSKK